MKKFMKETGNDIFKISNEKIGFLAEIYIRREICCHFLTKELCTVIKHFQAYVPIQKEYDVNFTHFLIEWCHFGSISPDIVTCKFRTIPKTFASFDLSNFMAIDTECNTLRCPNDQKFVESVVITFFRFGICCKRS